MADDDIILRVPRWAASDLRTVLHRAFIAERPHDGSTTISTAAAKHCANLLRTLLDQLDA